MKSVISVENLTKAFGKRKAVDRLSFQVQEGEILGFLGPNGAGKTTTMRVLAGYFVPTEGEVEIAGLNFIEHSERLKRMIGYLPEDIPLYRDLTAESFLGFAATLKGLSGQKRKKEIERVVDACRVGEVRHRLIGKLSKGFRQRVGLAQALLGSPPVLILDEPTSGLDPKQILEIRELIKSLRGTQTVILSTHILPEVSMVSDRVIIINEGRLVATGPPSELASRLRSSEEVTATVLGEPEEVKRALENLPGILNVEVKRGEDPNFVYSISCHKGQDLRPEIARRIVESGLRLVELRSTQMSLEDIFLKLVTSEPDAQETEEAGAKAR